MINKQTSNVFVVYREDRCGSSSFNLEIPIRKIKRRITSPLHAEIIKKEKTLIAN